jgi:hypothetical protein
MKAGKSVQFDGGKKSGRLDDRARWQLALSKNRFLTVSLAIGPLAMDHISKWVPQSPKQQFDTQTE